MLMYLETTNTIQNHMTEMEGILSSTNNIIQAVAASSTITTKYTIQPKNQEMKLDN